MHQQLNFKSKKLALFLWTASIVSNQTVFAQSTQSTVVVSGSRFEENLNSVPAQVKVITRQEIADSSSTTIPQVLSQIGGLQVTSTSGGLLNLDSTVDMGGYGATASSNTLILVDGQRLNPIDSGGVNWESVPIDSIERIEIVQGGASVQYGNGAVGGVINIITNGGAKNFNQASSTYGSYNTLINNAVLRNRFNNTTYQLTANTSNTDGWRQNSAANAYSFDAKITQSLGGKDSAYADVFFNHTNSQLPGAVLGQVGTGTPQLAQAKFLGATTTKDNSGVRAGITKEVNSVTTLELDGTYTNQNTNFNTPSSAPYNYYQSPNWQLAVSPKAKLNLGAFGTTVMGYDFNQASQSSSSGTIPVNKLSQNVQLLNQSIYVVSRIPLKIVDGLEASGGFRHQAQNAVTNDYTTGTAINANQKYSANAGDVALNYNYKQGQKLFVKWNQSYRFPNTDEFWGYDPNTYAPVFNGILKPQISQTYSVGGDWMVAQSRISASVFQSTTQNEIRYDPSTGANINSVGNINRNGVVVDSSNNLTSRLTLSGGGKFQKSTYSTGAVAGVGVGVAPNLILNARALYLLDMNWSFGGVINYVGSQNYDADPLITNSLAKMPSYAAADVFASYKMKSWEARFMIKNLGGNPYSSYAGYNSSSKYYYYPNTPRTYFVTAKYSFD